MRKPSLPVGRQNINVASSKRKCRRIDYEKESNTHASIQNLEQFRSQQQSENAALKAFDDKMKTSKRNMDDFRSDFVKANETSGRLIDKLWSEQRAPAANMQPK